MLSFWMVLMLLSLYPIRTVDADAPVKRIRARVQ